MEELNKENLKVIKLENGEILFSKVLVTDNSKTSGYLELHGYSMFFKKCFSILGFMIFSFSRSFVNIFNCLKKEA